MSLSTDERYKKRKSENGRKRAVGSHSAPLERLLLHPGPMTLNTPLVVPSSMRRSELAVDALVLRVRIRLAIGKLRCRL